jgi:HK97 family phage major capsid protein
MAYDDIISRGDNQAIEIPEQVSREVIQTATGSSVVMNLARRVTLSSKSYRQPVLSVLPDAYWVNGDTGLKQTTKVQWEDISLTAEPLAVLVVVPDEFIDDAMIPIWSEVRPLIAEAFGRKIDNAALWNVNRPSTWSDSVYQHAAAAGNFIEIGQNAPAGHTRDSDLAEDVAAMGLQLAQDGFQLRAFASEPGFGWRLLGMRTTDGTPIYTNLVGENRQGLYGKPFVESDNGAWNSEVKLIGGDWSNAIVGVRQDMTFTMHTDAVISDDSGNVVFNAMQQDSKIMRVVMRVGFAIANPLTRQNTVEASRSPFSLLIDEGVLS